MKYSRQSHTYMRNKKNFQRQVNEMLEASIQTDIDNKIKYEEKYGKFNGLIIVGTTDRINGDEPQIYDEEKQKSYLYGYYERGSKVLEGNFAKEIYTYEEQRAFGISDLKNNIPDKFLQKLKEYPAYLEGRIYQMGKNAYDFITENGITLEDYINLMKIIYPEVANEAFKLGYYEKLQEKSKKGSR